MTISLREISLLQEVLISLTNISTGTIQTLINLSKQNQDTATTHTLEKEITRLRGSIEAANGLVAFYDQRLREERENGEVKRHMEEAKILTDSIRAIRRVEKATDMPLLSRRNTTHNPMTIKVPSFATRDAIPAEGSFTLQNLKSRKTVEILGDSAHRESPMHPDVQPSRSIRLLKQLRKVSNVTRANSSVDPSGNVEIVHYKADDNTDHFPSNSRLSGSSSTPLRRSCPNPLLMPSISESCVRPRPGKSARSVSDGDGAHLRRA